MHVYDSILRFTKLGTLPNHQIAFPLLGLTLRELLENHDLIPAAVGPEETTVSLLMKLLSLSYFTCKPFPLQMCL